VDKRTEPGINDGNWCSWWDRTSGDDGPFLCFGLHTGYGGYGRWTGRSRQIWLD